MIEPHGGDREKARRKKAAALAGNTVKIRTVKGEKHSFLPLRFFTTVLFILSYYDKLLNFISKNT